MSLLKRLRALTLPNNQKWAVMEAYPIAWAENREAQWVALDKVWRYSITEESVEYKRKRISIVKADIDDITDRHIKPYIFRPRETIPGD